MEYINNEKLLVEQKAVVVMLFLKKVYVCVWQLELFVKSKKVSSNSSSSKSEDGGRVVDVVFLVLIYVWIGVILEFASFRRFRITRHMTQPIHGKISFEWGSNVQFFY